MKIISKILPYLRNKYIISLIVFIVWMIFFDRNDLISQYSYNQQLNKLQDDKAYYIKSIDQNQLSLHELMSEPENLEKFARERYLMKKEDEDIFLIVKE